MRRIQSKFAWNTSRPCASRFNRNGDWTAEHRSHDLLDSDSFVMRCNATHAVWIFVRAVADEVERQVTATLAFSFTGRSPANT